MKLTKSKVFIVGLIALLMLPQAAMANTDSFGVFANVLGGWISGNLGYIIAMTALIGSVVVYAFTQRGGVVVVGAIIAFLAGGSVGMSKLFFSQGGTAFSDTAAFTTAP